MHPARAHFWSRWIFLSALLWAPSCASRSLTIETEPPGAVVYVDLKEIGTTPLTLPFVHGGVHDFLILHEESVPKYKPLRVRQDVSNFFFDTFPFDLFVAVFPGEVSDDHVLRFQLEESRLVESVDADEDNFRAALLRRADEVRTRARIAQQEGDLPAPEFKVQPAAPATEEEPGIKDP